MRSRGANSGVWAPRGKNLCRAALRRVTGIGKNAGRRARPVWLNPLGGTTFRVHTQCATWFGYVYDAPGSGTGYSPPNKSQMAPQQGGSCGGNSAVGAWVESW